MKKIIILYNDAGGGHRQAACALQTMLAAQPGREVTLLNPYKELGSGIDVIKKLSKFSAEDLYNSMVAARRFSIISLLVIAGLFKLNLLIYRKKIISRLQRVWSDLQPDLVISVTPFLNQHIYKSVIAYKTQIPFLTIVTDYSECVRGTWISNKHQKIICSSRRLVRQALNRQVHRKNIYKLSGMIVAPKFYEVMQVDRQELRMRLELNTRLQTGLVMFGSHGAKDMLDIAKNMCRFGPKIQLIFVCGKNTKLLAELRKLKVNYNLLAVGFVDNIHEYMRCADFFIGKPGGISISEAAAMHLPMIIKYNMFTLLQERYNAQWVLENGLGVAVKNFKDISLEIAQMLQRLDNYTDNLAKLNNRAIFQIEDILNSV